MAFEAVPPIKKSIFNRPVFARSAIPKASEADVNTTDLFSRSSSSYLAVAAEEERKLERRVAKAAKRQEELVQQGTTTGGQKRQRSISVSSTSSENESEVDRRSSQTRSSPFSPPQAKRLSQSTKDEAEQSQATIGVSEASKSDEDDLIITSVTSRSRVVPEPTKALIDEEEEVESDDELAELARQARQAAKVKLESAQGSFQGGIHSFRGHSIIENRGSETPTGVKQGVIIAVSSTLPGVETKKFKRPLEKRLREVRIAWCVENGYSQEEAQSTILMLKGKRVFDINTPESLGISVDEYGDAQVDGDSEGLVDEEGRIIMEIIHENDLETYMGKHKGDIDELSQDEDIVADVVEVPPEPEPVQVQNIKIICRAKGLKDFKVVVKSDSTIARLQWAFILNHRLPADTEANVMLDGEILAPETTMTDLDIEDMDVFDVQVKRSQIIPSTETVAHG